MIFIQTNNCPYDVSDKRWYIHNHLLNIKIHITDLYLFKMFDYMHSNKIAYKI